MTDVFIAASHGTSSPQGHDAIERLVAAVSASAPHLSVRTAFIDVEQPDVPAVVRDVGPCNARIVPLLLSAGFHVHVDLVEAANRPGVTVCRALGPDVRLARVMARLLEAVGAGADDVVILAAAGSTDARAVADCVEQAHLLGELIGRPVQAAFLSAAAPSLTDAVRAARSEGDARVVVVSYLLAPGYFADLAMACGADAVTPPLLSATEPPPEELVEIVIDRYQHP